MLDERSTHEKGRDGRSQVSLWSQTRLFRAIFCLLSVIKRSLRKMVMHCCVCRVEKGSLQDLNFSFHRFPKNEDLKLKWCEAIGKEVYRNSVVCSKHFKAEDYKNCEDLNLIRKILKPSAVPSIKLSKHVKSIKDSHSSDIKDISTEKNDESFVFLNVNEKHEDNIIQNKSCDERLHDRPNVSTSINNQTKRTLETKATLCSTANQTKERKIKDNTTLKLLRKQRYQNCILGVVRKDDFINENAWLKFQKYIDKIQKQYKLLSHKNQRLHLEINKFRELLKKQLSDDI